jgi:hypothetical protein
MEILVRIACNDVKIHISYFLMEFHSFAHLDVQVELLLRNVFLPGLLIQRCLVPHAGS